MYDTVNWLEVIRVAVEVLLAILAVPAVRKYVQNSNADKLIRAAEIAYHAVCEDERRLVKGGNTQGMAAAEKRQIFAQRLPPVMKDVGLKPTPERMRTAQTVANGLHVRRRRGELK